MTASKMFAPPPTRQPVAVWIGLVLALLAAAVLLSNFVDALHVSMARGEAMRAAHQAAAPTDLGAGKQVLAVLTPPLSPNR